MSDWKPNIEIDPAWPKVKLDDVAKISNGYAFKSENYVNNGIRVIRITNVQKGEIVDADPKFYPTNSPKPVKKFELLENDLLVSLTGNVGRVGLMQASLLPAALNQRVACLRADAALIDYRYIFYFLNSDNFENACITSSSGVAQKKPKHCLACGL